MGRRFETLSQCGSEFLYEIFVVSLHGVCSRALVLALEELGWDLGCSNPTATPPWAKCLITPGLCDLISKMGRMAHSSHNKYRKEGRKACSMLGWASGIRQDEH